MIANQGTNQILRETPDGQLQEMVGRGTAGYSGDTGPALNCEINHPSGIAVASDGTIYFADTGNNRVRAVSPQGVITTVAGNGIMGSAGGGRPATEAELSQPQAVAFGPDRSLYIADDNGISKVSKRGRLTTVIRGGGYAISVAGSPTAFFPFALAIDSSGNIYAADFSPKLLVEFSPGGKLLNVWNTYVTAAGLAVAPDQSIVVGDYGNFSIDRVREAHLETVVSFSHDTFPWINGTFRPSGVAVSSSGEIYADTDGTNGGTNEPGLIVVSPNGHLQGLVWGGQLATIVHTSSHDH